MTDVPTITVEGLAKVRFDAPAFALEVRLAMARSNLSLRGLAALCSVDQATLHRITKHEKPPCVETYFRLREWLDHIIATGADHGAGKR